MKPNQKFKKPKMGITLYFTFIVMAEIAAVLMISYGVTSFLQLKFEIVLDIPLTTWMFLLSLTVGSTSAFFLNIIFFRPIRELSVAMKNVTDGDFKVQLHRKSKIKEIEDIYSNFNCMVKELSATEILQTDFVSNVSHEIKTPVNAIEGYAMLLQDSQCTEEERNQYIEKILFNTKRFSELVSNVLLLSKIENQSIETKQTKFRLDEQIRQSVMLFEAQWVEREIELDIDLEQTEYVGNESLLMHVWTNLLGNAIKFSPQGATVTITLIKDAKNIIYTIEDSGIGISADAKKHIFDKFYQADSSHKQEGNGLGLALVKRILDSCGAEILIESIEGKGSKFTVVLPNGAG